MVWNVTKDKITERVAVVNEHSWNPPMVTPPVPPDPNDRVGYSPEIEAGRFNVDDVLKPIYEESRQGAGARVRVPSRRLSSTSVRSREATKQRRHKKPRESRRESRSCSSERALWGVGAGNPPS